MLKKNERGIVDSVVLTTNKDGKAAVIVRLRCTKRPEIGDKFSSRHGQKGTIGIILAQEDMPFVQRTGMVPDIIVNPQAIPSRMTIGQLIECLLGKACALSGNLGDGTAFSGVSIDSIGKELERHGYSRHGTETMCCGFTGKTLESNVFIGPTYYQRLKHLVSDKIHSRSTGPTASANSPTYGGTLSRWRLEVRRDGT